MAVNPPVTVMLVAGEASGDRHAAGIFRKLKQLRPAIHGIGMGATHMREVGIDVRYDSSKIAVIGIVEVFRHFAEIYRALRLMRTAVCNEKPDLLICVDYKEFNLKLARAAKACGVKVLFYVSPQVWAWRPGRVKAYGEAVDMMAVIFPFEAAFYRQWNIPVRFVGHPLVDQAHTSLSRNEALAQFGFDGSGPLVGLLPGSRTNEINRLLPAMVGACEHLSRQFTDCRFVLFRASSVDEHLIARHLRESRVAIKVINDGLYDALQCCDAVITTSGTATLEVALLEVPMTITYRVNPITYLIGRWLIKIPQIGLPNIIAEKPIIREFLQFEATAENLCAEIARIISDNTYAETMRRELAAVKRRLGRGGGLDNVAQLANEMITESLEDA